MVHTEGKFELHAAPGAYYLILLRFTSYSLTIPVGPNGFSRTSHLRCGPTALSLWAGYILCLIGVISAAACSCPPSVLFLGRSSIFAF